MQMFIIVIGGVLLGVGIVSAVIWGDYSESPMPIVVGVILMALGLFLIVAPIFIDFSGSNYYESNYVGSGEVISSGRWKENRSTPYQCGKSMCVRTSTYYHYQYIIEMQDGRLVTVFSKDRDNKDALWGADIPVALESSRELYNYGYEVGDFVTFEITVRYPKDENDDSFEYIDFKGSNSIDSLETPITSSIRK